MTSRAGRPLEYDAFDFQVSFRWDVERVAQLKKLSRKKNIQMSDMIRAALVIYMQKNGVDLDD